MRLWLVRHTPWWILQALWRSGVVRRATVLRWEMNVALGEWQSAKGHEQSLTETAPSEEEQT